MRESLKDVIRDLAFPTLRYEVSEAGFDREKMLVWVVGRSGRRIEKMVDLSNAVTRISSSHLQSETAYQVVRMVKEAVRDIAEVEGIDWRANEEAWRTNGSRWERFNCM